MDSVRERVGLPDDVLRGAGVRIGILDTGIDPDHPDFRDLVGGGEQKSFVTLDRSPIDRHYHGSHVAGIIAGNGSASAGLWRGLAPLASVITYKVSDDGGMDAGAVLEAIAEAMNDDVDILNYSASHSPMPDIGPAPWIWAATSNIEDAFDEAAAAGILCVVAAGNDGFCRRSVTLSSLNRPAGLDSALTVGNAGRAGVVQDSSRGPYLVSQSMRRNRVERFDAVFHRDFSERTKPDVVAPGEYVAAPRTRHNRSPELESLATQEFGGAYVRVSGTSQATAVVSGLAACVLEECRKTSVNLGPNAGRTLKSIIMNGTHRMVTGGRYDFGRGLVNWEAILDQVKGCGTDPSWLSNHQRGAGLQRMD